jgi:hypothetical protein
MAGVWGLDFGTTNSLLTIITSEGANYLLDDSGLPHPSVTWYRGSEVVVGREAKEQLDARTDAIRGDFVRSPKRLLEQDNLYVVGGRDMDSRDIVADVLKHLKRDAESRPDKRSVERAVMTIPVKLDGNGRRRLRDAARRAGISVVQFVHEPLAALYAYFRRRPDYVRHLVDLDRCRILVFDWGGGTLDLTLCEIVGDHIVQIDNMGDNEVGGDFFDNIIRSHVQDRHGGAYGIDNLLAVERQESKIRLLNQCELAKIKLSEQDTIRLFIPNYLLLDGPARNLNVQVSRDDINTWTRNLVNRGLRAIDEILERNGIDPAQIALCLPTGGMVRMPAIRAGLTERFGARAVSLSDGDRIISEGAAWIAHDALKLGLAKPIELLQPDNTYTAIVPLPYELPIENDSKSIPTLDLRCADPRSGQATLVFARPNRPRPRDARSGREIYTTAHVPVDTKGPPLFEKIHLDLQIDHDYVVKIQLSSNMRNGKATAEIYDLEFTLRFPHPSAREIGGNDSGKRADDGDDLRSLSAKGSNILLKSNVTNRADWRLVPGDIVLKYHPAWFDDRAKNYAPWQKEEYDYFKLCPFCHCTRYEFRSKECEFERCIWTYVENIERKRNGPIP